MSKLAELQTRKNELFGQLTQLRNTLNQRKSEGKQGLELLSAEERQSFEKINSGLEKVEQEIGEIRSLDQVEQAYQQRLAAQQEERNRSGGALPFDNHGARGGDGASHTNKEEFRALAFQAWLRNAAGLPLSKKHVRAVKEMKFNRNERKIKFRFSSTDTIMERQFQFGNGHITSGPKSGAVKRAMTVGTTTEGGHTVPVGFINTLEATMLAYDGVTQVCDIMTTEKGNSLPWPTVNDTSNEGELVAESGSIGSTTDPSFGQITYGAYKYSSKLIRISTELLEDSAFDMASLIGRLLGERLGRISEKAFTTGDNSSKPQGVVTASSAGVTAAATNAITGDEIISLLFSLDPAYQGNASYMMHNNLIKAVRLLKDSNGVYLWQPGLQLGTPDMLNGKRLVLNQNMASSMTAAAKTILCGDFSKYKVRRVRGVRMVRLNELYAANDHVGFIAFMRQDGRMLDAGTDPVKHLAQAAS